jgi:hypothetical protein
LYKNDVVNIPDYAVSKFRLNSEKLVSQNANKERKVLLHGSVNYCHYMTLMGGGRDSNKRKWRNNAEKGKMKPSERNLSKQKCHIGCKSNRLQAFAVRNQRITNPSLSQDLILSNIPSTY